MALSATQQFYQDATACPRGIGVGNRVRRDWAYMQRPEQQACLYSFVIGALASATAGGVGGYCTGKVLASRFGLKPPADVPVVMACTALGVVGGGGYVAHQKVLNLESKKGFIIFQQDEITPALEQALKEKFSSDPVLENFACPLSQYPILLPKRSPSGGLYEGSQIEACADQVSGLIKDPYRNRDEAGSMFFPIAALKEDHEAALLLQKRFLFLIEEDIQVLEEGSEEHAIFTNHIDHLKDAIIDQYGQALQAIHSRRDRAARANRDATVLEQREMRAKSEEEVTEFEALFGEIPLDNANPLNWELNWKDKLDLRWKNSH